MNSSCAPLGPRRRNSLMMRLPAACTTGMFVTITTRTADTATARPNADLRMSLSLSDRCCERMGAILYQRLSRSERHLRGELHLTRIADAPPQEGAQVVQA